MAKIPTTDPGVPGATAHEVVRTGLEVLVEHRFKELTGKHVGLITNPTGIDRQYRANIDVFMNSGRVKLVALFGPEHGVRGSAPAGEEVGDARDESTGLPEYSLYGRNRKPNAAMLKGIDALVFDIQDIGSRSYTYITTLGAAMESAAAAKIPFFVLDRPNPLGGERIEGNITEPKFKSGVSPYPIPYVHGLTVGELAQMINGEGWLGKGRICDLHVVKMEGWSRSTLFQSTGLPWVSTSPHVPHPDTAFFYAATGIVGELEGLSIGVGMPIPFELAGAPGISPTAFAAELNRRKMPGITFRPCSFQPYYALFKGQGCGGVQIHITDFARAPLTRLNFELMDAARNIDPKIDFFPGGDPKLFDKVCGTDKVRKAFMAGKSCEQIWDDWNSGANLFRAQRQKYLLYR